MVQSSKHFGFQMALHYMDPLKFQIFLFLEKYQKDVENFVKSHWKPDLYCNHFGLFNIVQLFSYNL